MPPPPPFYPASSPFSLLPWRRLHKCQTDRRARDFVRARPSWGVLQAGLFQRGVPFRWFITIPGDDFVLSEVSVWVAATKNQRIRLKKYIYIYMLSLEGFTFVRRSGFVPIADADSQLSRTGRERMCLLLRWVKNFTNALIVCLSCKEGTIKMLHFQKSCCDKLFKPYIILRNVILRN